MIAFLTVLILIIGGGSALVVTGVIKIGKALVIGIVLIIIISIIGYFTKKILKK